MKSWQSLGLSILFAGLVVAAPLTRAVGAPAPAVAAQTIYGITAPDIDGKDVPLSNYKGKVLLVVNTASKCGFTPQYAGLERLYAQYKGQGLVVLGFPSNDFGGQEPGSSADIKKFCSSKYSVTFPMFAKVGVSANAQQSPLYKWLGSSGELPRWNFGKYLIGRDGKVIKFFGSMSSPDDDAIKRAVEKALAAKD